MEAYLNFLNEIDKNGVFSNEQKAVIAETFNTIINLISEWIYKELLPKTINADGELYGNDLIKKVKTNFA